jgi:hypothetical protein
LFFVVSKLKKTVDAPVRRGQKRGSSDPAFDCDYRDFERLRPFVPAGDFFATGFLVLDGDFFAPLLKIWSHPSENFSVEPVWTV